MLAPTFLRLLGPWVLIDTDRLTRDPSNPESLSTYSCLMTRDLTDREANRSLLSA